MYATKEGEREGSIKHVRIFSSKMNQNKMTPLFEIGLMENPFSYLLSFPLNDSLCSHSQGEKTRYLQG